MDPRFARRLRHGLLASTALAGLGAAPVAAGQLPTGYATAYGSVGFQRSSGTLNINQGSQAAIVNYNSFSIGRRSRVSIHQPDASAVLLNRVTGSTSTVIAGRLTANGQVYLINPNGIAITKSGVVKVGGGFVASSLGMTDDEFKTARRHFSGSGGTVSNRGTITIGRGGYADLIGGKVMNGGTIAVPMGSVGLGAGQMATLDVSGDGFLQVALPSTAGGRGALITDTGRMSGMTVMVDAATARAAARNAVNISGTIDSHTISGRSGAIQIGGGDGGAVAVSGRLSVASRRGIGGAVTITGTQIALKHARVDARGARGGGTVRIGGDLHGGGTLPHAGTVTVDARSTITADATRKGDGGSVVVWSDTSTTFAGRILARGGVFGGNGGTAEISGGTLSLTGTANVTAPRGALGTILLDPYDLTITDMSNGTANAAPTNGASPNVPADENGTTTNSYITPTQIAGLTGNVDIQTTHDLVVASNVSYVNGNLTLEAGRNLTVSSGVTLSSNYSLTLSAASGDISGYNPAGALTINGAVNAGENVTLTAGIGGIAIAANVNSNGSLLLLTTGAVTQTGGVVTTIDLYGGASSISLTRANMISGISTYGGSLFATSGGIALHTSGNLAAGPGPGASGTIAVPVGQAIDLEAGGNLTLTSPLSVSGAALTLKSGGALAIDAPVTAAGASPVTLAYSTSAPTNLSFAQGDAITFTANGGPATGPVTGQALSINGAPYMLIYNQAELNGIDNTATGGNGNNGTGASAYGPGLASAYALAGDLAAAGTYTAAPIASGDATNNLPKPFSGTLEGLGHTITGLTIVAPTLNYTGLVGYSTGTIRDIGVVGGSVRGFENVGDLVGENSGTVAQSFATGNVNTNTGGLVGGLVGFEDGGTITQAYATGAVSGTNYVGGLVGQDQNSTITQAYATGAVSGFDYVGGLIGESYNSTIKQAYATGAVIGGDGSIGGLVGYLDNGHGTINQAYATGAVSGRTMVGGLVGFNEGTIENAYATGAVSATGVYAGGLVGLSTNGTISQAYATGAVSGPQYVGGLVGYNTQSTISGTAYDAQTTGQAAGLGYNDNGQVVPGLTTAQLQGTSPANPFGANSGFAGGAAGGEPGVYPYLTSFFPNGVQAVSGFAYKDAGLTLLTSPASTTAAATTRPGYVTVTAGATTLATVTTGANGYYYTAVAAGSLPMGTNVAALTQADTGTNGSGAVNAVSFTSAPAGTATPSQASIAGLNVYGGYTTYGSYSPSLAIAVAAYQGALAAAETANPTVAAVAPGLAPGYLALGPSFALDAQLAANTNAIVAGGDGFAITTPATITGPLTLVGSSIAFDAPVTVNGGQLTLNTDAAGTLTFAAPLQYNPTGKLQSLTIDGHAYTLIYNETQLKGIGNDTYDALAASFNSTTDYAAVPIATYAGTLEGLGNTITGLTINAPKGTNVGLVGTLGTGGTLRDIGLVGGSVQGGNTVGMLVGTNNGAIINAYATGNASGSSDVGGLVGYNGSGTITGSHATGTVTGEDYVGGLVGYADGTITGSYATGTVKGQSDVGGLVGFSLGTISTSYATGAVSGSGFDVGGLVGQEVQGTISEVYATGSVNGPSLVGGLVGELDGGTITQGYASGAVSANFAVGGFVGSQAGGMISASYYDVGTTGQMASGVTQPGSTVTGLSTTAARGGLGNYTGFTAGDWYQTADLRPILTAEAAPTVAGVTTIGNSHQLELVGQNLAGTYVLPKNIDISDTVGSAAGVFSTNGFAPIGPGPDPVATFSGTFDGLGHTLTGLIVVRPTEPVVGLFSQSAGTIRNVGLVGGSVTGNVAGDLVGIDAGTIIQSFATGTVHSSYFAGGLVGGTESGASISQSFATGAVSGGIVGGFVGGMNGGMITESYAQGSVTGSPRGAAGGFVAEVVGGKIDQAYATGAVSGSGQYNAGFAVAVEQNSSITNAYFDSAKAPQTAGVVNVDSTSTATVTALSSQATPGSATDAFTNANYVGFDQTVWAPASGGATNYYPQLYGVSGVVGVKDPNATSIVYGTTPVVPTAPVAYYGLGPYNTLTSPATVSTTANAQSDVGTYAVTSTGAAATYTPGTTYLGPATRIVDLPGTLTITRAALLVTAVNGISKTYDGTTALPAGAVSYSFSGVRNNDAIGVAAASDAYDSPNAGPRMIDATSLAITGAKAMDYTLNTTSVSSTGTITPAPLTVTGAKTYDGTAGFATGQLAVAGAVNGETIMLTQGTGTAPSASAGTYMGAPLSNLAISVAGGNAMASNYNLPGSGTLVIGKATITVAGATGIDKTYDGTTALPNGATGFTDSGVLASDAGTVSVTASSAIYDSPNAGQRMVDVGGLMLSGAAAGNYMLSATSVTGSGTIIPAPLTVSGAKAYDGTAGFATGQLAVAGAVNGETIALTQGTGTSASADAGTYPDGALSNLAISVSGGNSMASNYSLPTIGVLTIGKATITVAGATGIDKTYDATNALPNGATSFTYTGVVGGDATVTASSAMYDSPNAGQRMVDVAGLTISGAAAGDYVLSATSVTGSGTITPATVIVTADGGRSIYGNVPANPGLSASGLQGGQGVGVLTGLSSSFALTSGSHAGSYTLSVQGTLTNGNYRVGATGDGTFTVDQRVLTITADNESRRYGAPNPPLTYTLGGMGLVNGDTLAGALATTVTRASGRGAYPIEQGTLAASADYAVTYVPGTLTVGAAPVVPAPVTPDISAADLASTADRAYWQVVGSPIDGLPFVFSLAAGEGPIGARIVQGLTDPRFDQVIVCVKDVCTLAAPKPQKPLRTSALEIPR